MSGVEVARLDFRAYRASIDAGQLVIRRVPDAARHSGRSYMAEIYDDGGELVYRGTHRYASPRTARSAALRVFPGAQAAVLDWGAS